jgi:hypothetical protein
LELYVQLFMEEESVSGCCAPSLRIAFENWLSSPT